MRNKIPILGIGVKSIVFGISEIISDTRELIHFPAYYNIYINNIRGIPGYLLII